LREDNLTALGLLFLAEYRFLMLFVALNQTLNHLADGAGLDPQILGRFGIVAVALLPLAQPVTDLLARAAEHLKQRNKTHYQLAQGEPLRHWPVGK